MNIWIFAAILLILLPINLPHKILLALLDSNESKCWGGMASQGHFVVASVLQSFLGFLVGCCSVGVAIIQMFVSMAHPLHDTDAMAHR